MANKLKNILWIVIGLGFPPILNAIIFILFIPGFFISFTPSFLAVSLLVIYLTVINITSFNKIKFSKEPVQKISFLLILILIYSIVSWYSFSIREGHKQGFAYTINNLHEYSDRYWYFLNRIHPLYPFTRNGSAYIDINHNLSIPPGFISLGDNSQRVGWHNIVSKKFYYMSFLVALIYGVNIALIVAKKVN